ncbi:MAG: hypothetical protein ABL917_03410 [Parcubacteria group bacterium]
MEVFISYKFTGEESSILSENLTRIKKGLENIGLKVYCNLFDDELITRSVNFKQKDWVFEAFNIIKNKQLLFVFLNSEEKSEGMILEIGYAIAKNIPIIVAVRSDIKNKTCLPGMANSIVVWENLEDLLTKISDLDLAKFKK